MTLCFANLQSILVSRLFFLFLQKNKDMAENNWFEKAWECLKKEDFAQAKAYFEKALEEGNAEAYFSLVTS